MYSASLHSTTLRGSLMHWSIVEHDSAHVYVCAHFWNCLFISPRIWAPSQGPCWKKITSMNGISLEQNSPDSSCVIPLLNIFLGFVWIFKVLICKILTMHSCSTDATCDAVLLSTDISQPAGFQGAKLWVERRWSVARFMHDRYGGGGFAATWWQHGLCGMKEIDTNMLWMM